MPRDGTGASDNVIEAGHNIVHGAGQEQSDHVARADKTATPPPQEKGDGLEGTGASGGGSVGVGNTGQGKGPLDHEMTKSGKKSGFDV